MANGNQRDADKDEGREAEARPRTDAEVRDLIYRELSESTKRMSESYKRRMELSREKGRLGVTTSSS